MTCARTLTHRYQKHTREQIYLYIYIYTHRGANVKILITINQMYIMKQSSLMSLLWLLPLPSWKYVIPPPTKDSSADNIYNPSINQLISRSYLCTYACLQVEMKWCERRQRPWPPEGQVSRFSSPALACVPVVAYRLLQRQSEPIVGRCQERH